jgi:hypothetical protein
MAVTRPMEALPVGWSPGPFASAGSCAALLLGAALAIHFGGLAAGGAVLAFGAAAVATVWCEAWLDGPSIRLRGPRSLGRAVVVHARGIDRIEYRRGLLVPRLSVVRRVDGVVLRASGPCPRAEGFRHAAMWLLVHGRRQARIDPALLDALAVMPDHAQADPSHDASHA